MIFASKHVTTCRLASQSFVQASKILRKKTVWALALFSSTAILAACGGADQNSSKPNAVENASEEFVNAQSLDSDSSIFKNALNPDKPEWFVPGSLEQGVVKIKEMLVETPQGSRKLAVRVTPDQALFDGDIVVNNPSENQATTESFGRSSAGYLWANGTIPYSFDARIPAVTRQRIQEAINHWNTKTKMRLVARTSERDFVTFRDGTGCSSNVGRTGGQQFVSLATACGTGNAIHEIGHAFGLWHEQSRTDRDSVVTVYWQNVDPAFKGNFEIEQNGSALLTSYDINSIMQYGSTAFARTSSSGRPVGPTMLLKNGSSFEAQRTALTTQDIAGVHKMYGY